MTAEFHFGTPLAAASLGLDSSPPFLRGDWMFAMDMRKRTHTQTVEGFFRMFKNGVRGVYHAIGTTHLQNYLSEYAWRYNHRRAVTPMFWTILAQAQKAPRAAWPS